MVGPRQFFDKDQQRKSLHQSYTVNVGTQSTREALTLFILIYNGNLRRIEGTTHHL